MTDHEAEVGWVAGIIDARGALGTKRSPAGNRLLQITVTISADRGPIIQRLCELTGTKPVAIQSDYDRTSCAQHCPTKHAHVHGQYLRWAIVGGRAVVVLRACLPHLALRRTQAEALLAEVGDAPVMGATLAKMAELGWAA